MLRARLQLLQVSLKDWQEPFGVMTEEVPPQSDWSLKYLTVGSEQEAAASQLQPVHVAGSPNPLKKRSGEEPPSHACAVGAGSAPTERTRYGPLKPDGTAGAHS